MIFNVTYTKMKKNILIILGVSLLLTLMSSCGSRNDYGDDYHKACKEADFDAAHDILNDLHADFINTYSSCFGDIDEGNSYQGMIESGASKYGAAAQYILTYEARYILANSSEQDRLAQLENLFLELQMIGNKIPAGTSYRPEGDSADRQICTDFNCYREYVKANNALADVIMSVAVTNKDKQLAAIALKHYLKIPVLGGEYSWKKYIGYAVPDKIDLFSADDDDTDIDDIDSDKDSE